MKAATWTPPQDFSWPTKSNPTDSVSNWTHQNHDRRIQEGYERHPKEVRGLYLQWGIARQGANMWEVEWRQWFENKTKGIRNLCSSCRTQDLRLSAMLNMLGHWQHPSCSFQDIYAESFSSSWDKQIPGRQTLEETSNAWIIFHLWTLLNFELLRINLPSLWTSWSIVKML